MAVPSVVASTVPALAEGAVAHRALEMYTQVHDHKCGDALRRAGDMGMGPTTLSRLQGQKRVSDKARHRTWVGKQPHLAAAAVSRAAQHDVRYGETEAYKSQCRGFGPRLGPRLADAVGHALSMPMCPPHAQTMGDVEARLASRSLCADAPPFRPASPSGMSSGVAPPMQGTMGSAAPPVTPTWPGDSATTLREIVHASFMTPPPGDLIVVVQSPPIFIPMLVEKYVVIAFKHNDTGDKGGMGTPGRGPYPCGGGCITLERSLPSTTPTQEGASEAVAQADTAASTSSGGLFAAAVSIVRGHSEMDRITSQLRDRQRRICEGETVDRVPVGHRRSATPPPSSGEPSLCSSPRSERAEDDPALEGARATARRTTRQLYVDGERDFDELVGRGMEAIEGFLTTQARLDAIVPDVEALARQLLDNPHHYCRQAHWMSVCFSDGAYECDECSMDILHGKKFYDCRICNFSRCALCSKEIMENGSAVMPIRPQ